MFAKMKKLGVYGWSWLRWPYDLCKEAKAKITLWITNTKAWKWLEARECDPPSYPLSWWATRGGLVVLLLAGTHWWSYEEGRQNHLYSAASFSLFAAPTETPDVELNYMRRLAIDRTNSMKRWKAIAERLDLDNKALTRRIQEMRAGTIEKANMASVAPLKPKVTRHKVVRRKAKAKPAAGSTWLSGP